MGDIDEAAAMVILNRQKNLCLDGAHSDCVLEIRGFVYALEREKRRVDESDQCFADQHPWLSSAPSSFTKESALQQCFN